MSLFRIALANLKFPATPEESVTLAERAIAEASTNRADIICFPECFVPGYRLVGKPVPPPDAVFLERAWSTIAAAAGKANVAVVLGTERLVGDGLRISALVIDRDGTIAGFQDKVQLDPSEEEEIYAPGSGRRIFQTGELRFGIAICHEGWRYPETVRWAARHGAHIVFHPHVHEAEPGGFRPTTFADPRNTFHEKAILCRAAENTCFVATVNCASAGSPTTSAVARPDGTLLTYQPYGTPGLLTVDIDTTEATGLLAMRCKTEEPTLLRLVEQCLWANTRWVEFVYSQQDPEVRPRELLAHLMLGERVWFERVAGQPRTTTTFPLMSQGDLMRGFAENADTYRQLIGSRLDDIIHFRRASGEEYHARVEDIVHHLLTHGYHHRGQLAAHYARSGMTYPNTDHINFLIENRL